MNAHTDAFRAARDRSAFLALEDGSVFRGVSFGAPVDAPGEAVFNTGMSGYQEILTDPSYFGQFMVLTAPEVGNYGFAAEDDESRAMFLSGLIVRRANPPSNWRSVQSLQAALKAAGKPAIYGVDTRALTLLLRDKGTQKAWLHASLSPMTEEEAVSKARTWQGLDGLDSVANVTSDKFGIFAEGTRGTVAVLNFGVKRGILRSLASRGFRVAVFPASATASEILALNPSGVLLSNGPGDPQGVPSARETVRALLGKVPIMGICLGHQLFALSCGASTARLPFGHHGCNHPVRDLETGTVAITSQNHNFTVKPESLPPELAVTHINLNDGTIEGLRHKTLPAFSVQFHPEASPGPNDAAPLFDQFERLMSR